MMTTIFSISIVSTFTFMFMNHPLSMGGVLMIQTIMVSLISGFLNSNFWFSYILTLIMVGGMLILFMYMTSIASNEKFKPSTKMTIMMIFMFLLTTLIAFLLEKTINNNETKEFLMNKKMIISLHKFISMPLSLMLLFMMIYLLIAMIASTKITKFNQGSIRQMK